MPVTGNENHEIGIDQAAELTARYRESVPTGSITGGFFGREALREILDQAGCMGIRYYYGIDEANKPVLVLVGVDDQGDDLHEGKLAELSLPCPNLCSTANKLNSNM